MIKDKLENRGWRIEHRGSRTKDSSLLVLINFKLLLTPPISETAHPFYFAMFMCRTHQLVRGLVLSYKSVGNTISIVGKTRQENCYESSMVIVQKMQVQKPHYPQLTGSTHQQDPLPGTCCILR